MHRLKAWITRTLGAEEADEDAREQARNLAVAALLVEVLRADYATAEAERRQVVESLRGILGLGESESAELLAEAEHQVDKAHDLHQFTAQINRALAHDEKLHVIEQMWRVARSDATVHKYEEHIIRRVSDLLHVSHREFIAAKLRASAG